MTSVSKILDIEVSIFEGFYKDSVIGAVPTVLAGGLLKSRGRSRLRTGAVRTNDGGGPVRCYIRIRVKRPEKLAKTHESG